MITFRLDVRDFTRACRTMGAALPSQLANGLNTTARAARTAFNKAAAAEIGARQKWSTDYVGTELKRASPADLRAEFRPSRSSANMSRVKIKDQKPHGLTVATHIVTKGSKHFQHGFILGKTGMAMNRPSPSAMKPLKLTTAARLMKQEDSPARAIWFRVAEERLAPAMDEAVRRAAAKAGFL